MNRSELNEKAKKYISDVGFGTGTNITLHVLKCMMVDFCLDNQVKNFDIYPVVKEKQKELLITLVKGWKRYWQERVGAKVEEYIEAEISNGKLTPQPKSETPVICENIDCICTWCSGVSVRVCSGCGSNNITPVGNNKAECDECFYSWQT